MDLDLAFETKLKRRLIVLVPEGLNGHTDLARNIYQMAITDHCDVLYLAFVSNEDNRLLVSRYMATLKALTVADSIVVSTKIVQPENWLAVLHEVYCPGDQLVCHAGQMVKQGVFKSIPIQDLLSEEFDAPVTSMSGLYHPWQVLSKRWIYGVVFWLGCLLILAGFGFVEFQIDHGLQGFARTSLLMIVWVLELGSFMAWNHMPKI